MASLCGRLEVDSLQCSVGEGRDPYLVPARAVVVGPPGEGGVPDGELLPDALHSDDLGPPGASKGGVVTVLGVVGGSG